MAELITLHAMKAFNMCKSKAPLFLTWALDGGDPQFHVPAAIPPAKPHSTY